MWQPSQSLETWRRPNRIFSLLIHLCFFPQLPKVSPKGAIAQTAPPIILPNVTGIRLLRNICAMDISAPRSIPNGMINILATEWSNPNATKAEMGNQTAVIFPVMVATSRCHIYWHAQELLTLKVFIGPRDGDPLTDQNRGWGGRSLKPELLVHGPFVATRNIQTCLASRCSVGMASRDKIGPQSGFWVKCLNC